MSNKERSKIRRNNYRAWKQAHKQQKSSAPASSGGPALPAAPAPSVGPAAPAAAPQPKTSAPFDPRAPLPVPPGAFIPFNPSAPVDVVLLHQRLRYGGPEVTDQERLAIAHRLEQYAALEFSGDNPKDRD